MWRFSTPISSSTAHHKQRVHKGASVRSLLRKHHYAETQNRCWAAAEEQRQRWCYTPQGTGGRSVPWLNRSSVSQFGNWTSFSKPKALTVICHEKKEDVWGHVKVLDRSYSTGSHCHYCWKQLFLMWTGKKWLRWWRSGFARHKSGRCMLILRADESIKTSSRVPKSAIYSTTWFYCKLRW